MQNLNEFYKEEYERDQKCLDFTNRWGITIWLGFWLLDLLSYPDEARLFLIYRLSAVLVSLLNWAFVTTGWGSRYLTYLSTVSQIAASVCVAFMCARLGGFTSFYFVGIIVIMMFGALFHPWSTTVAWAYALLCVAPYFFVNATLHGLEDSVVPMFFLTGAGAATVLACRQSFFARLEAFKLRKAAEEANAAKSRFLANISHELRTPVMLIRGPIEAMREEKRFDEQLVEVIEANCDRLTRHLDALLDLQKGDNAGLRLRPTVGCVRSTVEHIVELARPFAERRQLNLVVSIAEATPSIEFDAHHMETIVANLLSNSIKYSLKQGTVSVVLCPFNEGLRLSVKDTGIGIESQHLKHIFEPFHQVDHQHEAGGTGIGLALTKQLVELHGGTIHVQSAPGLGTSFDLWFPLELARQDVLDRRRVDRRRNSRRSEDRTTVVGNNSPKTTRSEVLLADLKQFDLIETFEGDAGAPADAPLVLVVDDNIELRAFVTRALRQKYRVQSAVDGKEGLEKSIRLKPDVVVTDITMGRHGGYELLSQLRKKLSSSQTRVIMLTARAGSEDAVSSLDAGADDYLRKPFAVDELRARIRNQLRLRDTESSLSERDTRLLAIGSMASTIVHDVRNAISGVVSTASLAMLEKSSQDTGSRISERLEAIEEQGMGTVSMLEELLDYAKGGLPALCPSRVRVDTVITDAFKSMEAAMKISNIKFTKTGEVSDKYITVDKSRIQRALGNLLSNAKDAVMECEVAERRVEIGVSHNAQWLSISVLDSGPGIEDTSRVFDEFVSNKAKGTGLGLAMVRNVIKSHHGKIDVIGKSKLGGAEFTLHIPMQSGTTAPTSGFGFSDRPDSIA